MIYENYTDHYTVAHHRDKHNRTFHKAKIIGVNLYQLKKIQKSLYTGDKYIYIYVPPFYLIPLIFILFHLISSIMSMKMSR